MTFSTNLIKTDIWIVFTKNINTKTEVSTKENVSIFSILVILLSIYYGLVPTGAVANAVSLAYINLYQFTRFLLLPIQWKLLQIFHLKMIHYWKMLVLDGKFNLIWVKAVFYSFISQTTVLTDATCFKLLKTPLLSPTRLTK